MLVDSRLIAKHLGITHKSAFKTVKSYLAHLERFGILRFQSEVIKGRGQPEKYVLLIEDQCIFLLNLSRNTDSVVELKFNLVKAFREARQAIDITKREYLIAAERYMMLALKAQSQCRATLETLSAIKNPPVVFAKQANIANGPQQVNNGQPATVCEKTVIEQNKLLEYEHGQWLDTGTADAAIGADKELETVGAIDRA